MLYIVIDYSVTYMLEYVLCAIFMENELASSPLMFAHIWYFVVLMK